jgi:hypothetical protein
MNKIESLNILTKEFLYQEYIVNKKSTNEIALEHNCHPQTVGNYLRKNNIFIKEIHDRNKGVDYTGKEFNQIKVLEVSPNKKPYTKIRNWKCLCKKCNNIFYLNSTKIKEEKINSCLCRRKTGYKDISGKYWASIRGGARIRKLDFNITQEYAWSIFEKQKSKCNLSGEFLIFSKNCSDKNKQTASLDRIDSAKGYIEGNIQWVHKDINRLKNDFNQDYFLRLVEKIYKNKILTKV